VSEVSSSGKQSRGRAPLKRCSEAEVEDIVQRMEEEGMSKATLACRMKMGYSTINLYLRRGSKRPLPRKHLKRVKAAIAAHQKRDSEQPKVRKIKRFSPNEVHQLLELVRRLEETVNARSATIESLALRFAALESNLTAADMLVKRLPDFGKLLANTEGLLQLLSVLTEKQLEVALEQAKSYRALTELLQKHR
jgi:transposase